MFVLCIEFIASRTPTSLVERTQKIKMYDRVYDAGSRAEKGMYVKSP